VGATVLPELGHYPHVEDPDAVMSAFLAFHAGLPPRD
jgi:pimeloyl-ACP methyl ester carboxylesterase